MRDDTRDGTGNQLDAEHPWPGLVAFAEDDQKWFRGREGETAALFRLVSRSLTSVVFGRSGVGKSSLLQAGLFPRLRDGEFLPVYIRLAHDDDAPPLRQQLLAAVSRAARVHVVESPTADGDRTLWEHFHRVGNAYWSGDNRPLAPVLVIDQFEEMFTVGRESSLRATRTREFLEELSDLAEGRVPPALKQRLDEGEGDPESYDFGQHRYHLVLAMREDLIAELEALTDRMPSVIENRFRLSALTGVQALEVTRAGGDRLVPPGVGERIVRLAAGADGKRALADLVLDPVILSLLCLELNERRLRLGDESIREGDVGVERRDEILADFYRGAVQGLGNAASTFVETSLLTRANFRDSVALENALAAPGVTEQLLRTLERRRLIRREERDGRVRVELTHDVLVDVVRRSRDARTAEEIAAAARAREAAAEAERAQEAERARLAEQREAQALVSVRIAKRAAWRARMAAGIAVILAIAAGYAVWRAGIEQTYRRAMFAMRADSPTDVALQVMAVPGAESEHRILKPLTRETNTLLAHATLVHGTAVHSVGFGPLPGQVFSVGGGVAILWSVSDSGFFQVLRDSASASNAAISPDGALFVVAGEGDTLRVWKTGIAGARNQVARVLGGGDEELRARDPYACRNLGPPPPTSLLRRPQRPIRFSGNGKWAVYVVESCLRIYSLLSDSRPISIALGGTSSVVGASPGMFAVATATLYSDTVHLWIGEDRRHTVLPHEGGVSSVEFLPQDSLMIAATKVGELVLWNYVTGKRVLKQQLHEETAEAEAWVYPLSTDSAGRNALAWVYDASGYEWGSGTLIRWNLERNRIDTLIVTEKFASRPGFSTLPQQIAASVDSLSTADFQTLVQARDDLEFRVEAFSRSYFPRTPNAQLLHSMQDDVWTFAINRRASWALTGGEDGSIKVWNLRKGQYAALPEWRNVMQVSDDGRAVLLSGSPVELRQTRNPDSISATLPFTANSISRNYWQKFDIEWRGRGVVRSFRETDSAHYWHSGTLRANWIDGLDSEYNQYCQLSADGDWLLATADSAGKNGRRSFYPTYAYVWDLSAGTGRQVLGRNSSCYGRTFFNEQSERIVLRSDSINVLKLNPRTRRFEPEYSLEGDYALFSPRSGYLAVVSGILGSGGPSDTVSIFRSDGQSSVLANAGVHVDSLFFSHDERWLAVLADSEVVVASTTGATTARRYFVPCCDELHGRFSPDGKWLAIWSETRSILIGLVRDAPPIEVRYGGEFLQDLTFNPASEALISGTMLWRLSDLRRVRSTDQVEPHIFPGEYLGSLPGDRFVTRFGDGTAIFDLAVSNRPLLPLPSPPPEVGPIAHPDGEHLILRDGIYPVTSKAAMARLRKLVHGCVQIDHYIELFGASEQAATRQYAECLEKMRTRGGAPIDWNRAAK